MNQQFQERMRKELLARRAEIVNADAELSADTKGLQENDDVDLVDHGQHAAAAAVIMTLDDQERREVAAIDAALERITDGKYGICAECEEDIPEERLEVLPEATTCVECAA